MDVAMNQAVGGPSPEMLGNLFRWLSQNAPDVIEKFRASQPAPVVNPMQPTAAPQPTAPLTTSGTGPIPYQGPTGPVGTATAPTNIVGTPGVLPVTAANPLGQAGGPQGSETLVDWFARLKAAQPVDRSQVATAQPVAAARTASTPMQAPTPTQTRAPLSRYMPTLPEAATNRTPLTTTRPAGMMVAPPAPTSPTTRGFYR